MRENYYLCSPKNWRIMLAIVKIAGQQFKVKAGDSLYVPHIQGATGDSVELKLKLSMTWLRVIK